MTRRLTRRNSFQTKQEYGDCWLYATCTLTSNYYLNMDLELNGSKSIFKDFNDEEKCKVPLYNNFNRWYYYPFISIMCFLFTGIEYSTGNKSFIRGLVGNPSTICSGTRYL